MRRNPRLHRNVLVQRNLSEIFVRESSDPRFQRVTVSRVEASKDMSFAKVFVSIFPSEGKIALVESLNAAA
ncbi:MAG TPA: ribosome-binding factor A, partial [Deltaproteobacteria bacterium]|nr:ribosome-binding factor A [Deltaproteobacteria bacterium]